jgi:hypothetical protein
MPQIVDSRAFAQMDAYILDQIPVRKLNFVSHLHFVEREIGVIFKNLDVLNCCFQRLVIAPCCALHCLRDAFYPILSGQETHDETFPIFVSG